MVTYLFLIFVFLQKKNCDTTEFRIKAIKLCTDAPEDYETLTVII